MKNSTKKLLLNRQRATKWLFSFSFLVIFSFSSFAQCLMHDETHNHEDEDLIMDDFTVSATESGGETELCYIAVNMHFIADDYGNKNFTPYDDGHGNTNYTGYDRAEQLIDYCNYMLANNQPMHIGTIAGQAAPKVNWRLTLKGVYFHNNSDYQFDDIWDFHSNWNMHNDYQVNETEIINLYAMQGDIDCDPNGFPYLRGIANGLGSFPAVSKTANDWRYYTHVAYTTNNPTSPQMYNETARNILHELGHNFGLRHAWYANDGCGDTPQNSNTYCSQSGSNNLMDYNCYKPTALTPCQVNTINTTLNNQLSSYILQCGCEPTSAFFSIPSTISIGAFGGTWLRGTGSWKETSYKLEIFSVNQSGSTTPANPSDIYVTTSSGTVGNINLNSTYNFTGNTTYLIRLTTYNDCGSDVMLKYINAIGPISGEPGGGDTERRINQGSPNPIEIRLPSLNKEQTIGIEITPNPARDRIILSYEALSLSTSEINFSIISLNGKEVFRMVVNDIAELPNNLSLDKFSSGLYLIVLQNGQTKITKKLIILE